MKFLLVLIRIYWWIVIAWAVSTWLPIPPNIITDLLWLLTWPVWKLFGWMNLGPINLGGIAFLMILWVLENWVKKQVEEEEVYHPGDEPEDEEQEWR